MRAHKALKKMKACEICKRMRGGQARNAHKKMKTRKNEGTRARKKIKVGKNKNLKSGQTLVLQRRIMNFFWYCWLQLLMKEKNWIYSIKITIPLQDVPAFSVSKKSSTWNTDSFVNIVSSEKILWKFFFVYCAVLVTGEIYFCELFEYMSFVELSKKSGIFRKKGFISKSLDCKLWNIGALQKLKFGNFSIFLIR